MKKSRKRLVLNQRDQGVMHFIFEHRVATQEQIGRRFFPECKRQTVQERLSKILKYGFVDKKPVAHRGKLAIAYGLTDKGFSEVARTYKFAISNTVFKSDSMVHDICLVDIRDKLASAKSLVTFIPENVLQACESYTDLNGLKSFSRLNSDAALLLDTPSGRYFVALEYEANSKATSRYVQKLKDYYFSPEIAAVFYVCENEDIQRAILQTDAEIGQKWEPKLYSCLRQTVHLGKFPLAFTNRRNGKFMFA